MSKQLVQLLQERFPEAIVETHAQFGDDTVVVAPAHWREIAFFLRDDSRAAMNLFIDLCGVDYSALNMVTGHDGEPRRFEVVLHVRSIERGHRLRLKARVGDEEGDDAEIDSLVPVWRGANWFERETYDLMGIRFRGHPDLRRILMYEEFVGHPLRKDYPANRIQPLVEFREVLGKLPPFGPDEGMPFGRQDHERRMYDADGQAPHGELTAQDGQVHVESPIVRAGNPGTAAARED